MHTAVYPARIANSYPFRVRCVVRGTSIIKTFVIQDSLLYPLFLPTSVLPGHSLAERQTT